MDAVGTPAYVLVSTYEPAPTAHHETTSQKGTSTLRSYRISPPVQTNHSSARDCDRLLDGRSCLMWAAASRCNTPQHWPRTASSCNNGSRRKRNRWWWRRPQRRVARGLLPCDIIPIDVPPPSRNCGLRRLLRNPRLLCEILPLHIDFSCVFGHSMFSYPV